MRINPIDITGQKFYKLTAVSYAGNENWLFECECGAQVIKKAADVKRGNTKACSRMCGKTVAINHPLYQTWDGMKKRCYNPKATGYERYGGRGIEMCERWKSSFWNFVEDMGPKPFPSYSLNRIDNSLNYSKENCEWSTAKEQATNRRNTLFVTHNNVKYSLFEICKKMNLVYSTIHYRIHKSKMDAQEYFEKYIF